MDGNNSQSDQLAEMRRQARLNRLRLQIAQQNEALAALRRAGFRDALEDFYDPSNIFNRGRMARDPLT